MNPTLHFTSATDADIPMLRSLADTIWHACYPGIITHEQIDYMLGRMYAAEVIRRELAAGVRWQLTHLDGEPIGFLSCPHDATQQLLKLNKLYLLPAHHGRGLGRAMLEHVKTLAAELHATRIWLTVNKANARAIRAYERAGFRTIDAVVTDIGGGFVMDDFVMECPVA
jgi:diamine N-acetyltransferase